MQTLPAKAFAVLFFILGVCLASPSLAATETFLAPQGQVSSLMIFEQTGFARVYGVFKEGIARFMYDDQLKTLDDLKLALLIRSFTSASPTINHDFMVQRAENLDKEKEVAFLQSEPARFNEGKASVKGDLLINGIRKPVVMDAELNKYGRISQTTDVMEQGKSTVGFSMHTTIKRSDYNLSSNTGGAAYNDDVVLMIDALGQR